MGSEGGRGEERAGWKNGGRDDGPNCCIGHWREGEKERERGREGEQGERARGGEGRRGKSLLESAGALQFTQCLLQPHQLSGQLRATSLSTRPCWEAENGESEAK